MNRTVTPSDIQSQVELKSVLVLDVRRLKDFAADSVMLPGAQWKDPEQLAEWSATLPKDKEVVVYCARGGSVSNSVLDHLREKGLSARYIEGGIEAWKAAGAPTTAK